MKDELHRNPGGNENYQVAYDQESIDMINAAYREEIVRFGYSF